MSQAEMRMSVLTALELELVRKRPLSITLIGWLYIAVGVIGGIAHLFELRAGEPFRTDVIWIELLHLVAIAAGVWLLRGQNWARWVAVAWMGLHVIVSIFHNVPELLIHCALLGLIALFLFRAAAAGYFRPNSTNQFTPFSGH